MNKDVYETVTQVVKDLLLPELAKLQADIQQIEKRLATPGPSTSTASPGPTLVPLSPTGSAYVNAIAAEINERTEREASEWVRRKAKDPNAKASTLAQIDAQKRQAK